MDTINLDITQYSKDDIIDILGLPQQYNEQMVASTVNHLRQNCSENKTISVSMQRKILSFLTDASLMLLKTDAKDNQYRTADPYVVVDVNQHVGGIVNPLQKRTCSNVLNIDSRFRENYYGESSANYHIQMPMKIKNVLSMQVSTVELLPFSYYAISSDYNNHFFTIRIVDPEEIIEIREAIIILANGNYNYDTLLEELNDKIAIAFPSDSIVASIDEHTRKMSFTYTTDTSTLLVLDFQMTVDNQIDTATQLTLKLGWMLGFRGGIYDTDTQYVTEGMVDVLGPKYLFLVIDDHINNVNANFISAFPSSTINNNTIARISIQPDTTHYQLGENITSTTREYFGPVNLQSLHIQLLDEYGRVIDTNFMDYSICLILTTSYDIR